jgi:hypothetical protein
MGQAKKDAKRAQKAAWRLANPEAYQAELERQRERRAAKPRKPRAPRTPEQQARRRTGREALKQGEFMLAAFPGNKGVKAKPGDGRLARRARNLESLVAQVRAEGWTKERRTACSSIAQPDRRAEGITTAEWCKRHGLDWDDYTPPPPEDGGRRDNFWTDTVESCTQVAPGWVITMLCHLGGHINITTKGIGKKCQLFP